MQIKFASMTYLRIQYCIHIIFYLTLKNFYRLHNYTQLHLSIHSYLTDFLHEPHYLNICDMDKKRNLIAHRSKINKLQLSYYTHVHLLLFNNNDY